MGFNSGFKGLTKELHDKQLTGHRYTGFS